MRHFTDSRLTEVRSCLVCDCRTGCGVCLRGLYLEIGLKNGTVEMRRPKRYAWIRNAEPAGLRETYYIRPQEFRYKPVANMPPSHYHQQLPQIYRDNESAMCIAFTLAGALSRPTSPLL
jgi:hypothetical protein